MVDILEKKKKRIKLDYKLLIKGHGLWSCYKRFRKHLFKLRSERRKMYLFCKSYLASEMAAFHRFNAECEFISTNRSLGWED